MTALAPSVAGLVLEVVGPDADTLELAGAFFASSLSVPCSCPVANWPCEPIPCVCGSSLE